MVSPKKIRAKKPAELAIIRSLEEIPQFASEDDEREWWASHQLSEELYAQLQDASTELDEILRPTAARLKRASD